MDPFRNSASDICDALDHASDFQIDPSLAARYRDCSAVSMFNITSQDRVPVAELYNYDDIDSWAEWDDGELADLSPSELLDELSRYRNAAWAANAIRWYIHNDFPAVVVIEDDVYDGIGDGRGRISLAIGLGITQLPVIFMQR